MTSELWIRTKQKAEPHKTPLNIKPDYDLIAFNFLFKN